MESRQFYTRKDKVVLWCGYALLGLFSLADDVRAAVGIGERGALAARFFATLRGGYFRIISVIG